MTLTHVVSDYAERLALFDSGSNFYFIGTVSNATPATTSQFSFSMIFNDACRTATVVPQTIVYPPVRLIESVAASLSVPAFQDSVDGAGYPTGICGEKTVLLDAGSPAFLTLY